MVPTAQLKPDYFFVSWEQFHSDCRKLAETLAAMKQWYGVIAVARGGLVPAAIIAHELNLRLVDAVSIASYTDTTQGDVRVLKGLQETGLGWLIIDDLVDTGKTASALKQMLPNAHLATVYAKPAGKPLTDTYVVEIPQHTWVVFPWETPPDNEE